jgi:tetratricopeptide (TPR) repeat protein
LTKIIVGVGLVELNKIPPALHFLAITLSPGLRPYNSPELAGSSVVFALALLLYFFPLGFMFGFIWTRFYFQEALKGLLERIRVLEKKRVAANFAEVADARIDEGRLDLAATQVDKALARDSNNAKALFVKARILKRQAWSPSSNTWDKSLLKEALHYASKASALIPDRAAPLYNMACYQALLDESPGDVAATLRRAFEINPELARNAADDSDLRELREKDTSIQTLIDEYSKKSKAP